MRSERSYLSTVAAFSNAESKAEGAVCAFSTLTVVFVVVCLRMRNVFIYFILK